MSTKRYDPARDTGLKLVHRPDEIDPYDDEPTALRAVASCGHVVAPESMTAWCRNLLDQGRQFSCPVGGCGKVWPYEEVRKLGLLTPDETLYFELALTKLSCQEQQFKSCPGCKILIQREDPCNLSVNCKICSSKKKKNYEFCWQCLQEWVGPRPRSDHCDNDSCLKGVIQILTDCPNISLVRDVTNCPSVRACPICGTLVEHNKRGCKNVKCPNCKKEFCFVCLKLTSECLELKPHSHFNMCANGVAPRQTCLPCWNSK